MSDEPQLPLPQNVFTEGADSCARGLPRGDCPYPPGSAERDQWLAGWDQTAAVAAPRGRAAATPDSSGEPVLPKDIFAEGTDSCAAGLSRKDCPYPPGSIEREQWIDGWNQAARAR